MSPYGLLADLHKHAWSQFSTVLPNGVNSRLQGLLDEVQRAAQEVKAAGGRKLVFAGDVFHVRGSVAPSVLNPVRDTLNDIVIGMDMEIVILAGNHDLEGKDATRLGSAITALEGPGIKVCNAISFDMDLNVVLVPWIESIEHLKKELELAAVATPVLANGGAAKFDLIIHAPIDGVIEGLPTHGLDAAWLSSLGFKRVFAGHYHNHRCMTHGDADSHGVGEVWSIGALAHHTWSDIGSRAGFLIVHDDKVIWRKSHLPEFVDLGKAAEYCEPDELPLVVDGNYVRVRVDADKAKDAAAAREELLAMGARAVLVQAMPKAPVREGAVTASVVSGASLEASVTEFIKGFAGDRTEAVTKAAFEILGAAETVEV
jgi:DNA repair exonuclease SbcCD nuclease subunit